MKKNLIKPLLTEGARIYRLKLELDKLNTAHPEGYHSSEFMPLFAYLRNVILEVSNGLELVHWVDNPPSPLAQRVLFDPKPSLVATLLNARTVAPPNYFDLEVIPDQLRHAEHRSLGCSKPGNQALLTQVLTAVGSGLVCLLELDYCYHQQVTRKLDYPLWAKWTLLRNYAALYGSKTRAWWGVSTQTDPGKDALLTRSPLAGCIRRLTALHSALYADWKSGELNQPRPEIAGFAQGICVLDAAELLADNPQEGD